ncbi:MAG: type II and III secretion system protein family protein [Candidatus Binataceae bacterium]
MPATAKDNAAKMSLTIGAGQTYTIDGVKAGATPGVTVISNPGALVIHGEVPGKVTLLGAESGEWKVKLTMADGSKAIYDVTVKSVANPYAISSPASYGAVVSGSTPSGIYTPPVAKLEKAAGPAGAPSAPKAAVLSESTLGGARTVTVPESSAPKAAAAQPAAALPLPVSVAPVAKAPAPASPVAAQVAPIKMTTNMTVVRPSLKYLTNPAIAIAGGAYSTPAVNGGKHYLPADVVELQTGTSRVIDFAARVRRISVADTKIADIEVINPYQINLIGHTPGFTTLAVWNKQGEYEERSVRVDPDGTQQVLLNTMVAELNRSALETQGTNLSAFLVKQGVGLESFPGYVGAPYSPTAALGNTQPAAGVVPNPGGLIPLLLSQNPTYALTAQNSNVQVEGLFQYLETHDLAKVLAQPNLLANSGEEAKFLDGGEIPIVIAQALNTSIVFKQYGTSVEFVPTVVGSKTIELLVKPELSEPDFTHGVTEFGFVIPAFVTRRAETMVRLMDNQTLIIAGLLLHEKTTSINKVPYFGDIPYLGGLFRTTSYNNSESELVMSVTPQIVRPLPAASEVYNPTTMPEMTREQIETKRLPQPDVTRPRF